MPVLSVTAAVDEFGKLIFDVGMIRQQDGDSSSFRACGSECELVTEDQ